MRLISLVLLAVQLVCIAMGVPYGQPIASQPVVNQPVVDHQDFGHSTIAAPENSINRTISFPTTNIYLTISIPKDDSVYTTSTGLTSSSPRNTVNTALDDAPKTPVNGPYGVSYLTTSFSPSNTEILRAIKADSFFDYPTNDYPTIINTNLWSEEDTSKDYLYSGVSDYEPYEVTTITGTGYVVTRITEYVTITELSRIRVPDCPTVAPGSLQRPRIPSRSDDYISVMASDPTNDYRTNDYPTNDYRTTLAEDTSKDCDINQPPHCFIDDRQSCLVHPPPYGVEGSAWTVHCTAATADIMIASAPPLPCERCSSRVADSRNCEFVRQAC